MSVTGAVVRPRSKLNWSDFEACPHLPVDMTGSQFS